MMVANDAWGPAGGQQAHVLRNLARFRNCSLVLKLPSTAVGVPTSRYFSAIPGHLWIYKKIIPSFHVFIITSISSHFNTLIQTPSNSKIILCSPQISLRLINQSSQSRHHEFTTILIALVFWFLAEAEPAVEKRQPNCQIPIVHIIVDSDDLGTVEPDIPLFNECDINAAGVSPQFHLEPLRASCISRDVAVTSFPWKHPINNHLVLDPAAADKQVTPNQPKSISQDFSHFVDQTGSDLRPEVLNAMMDLYSRVHPFPLNFDTAELRALVYKTLKEKSDGMFLWVKMMLGELRKAANVAEVETTLGELPRGLVRLGHISIKEFLTRPRTQFESEDPALLYFQMDLEDTNRSLGSSCLDYLSRCNLGFPLGDPDVFSTLPVQYPLLSYVSRYTAVHIPNSGSPTPDFVAKIDDFTASRQSSAWVECLVLLVFQDMIATEFGEDFIKLRYWYDDAMKEGHFMDQMHARWREELGYRKKAFGEQDLRTELWQNTLSLTDIEPSPTDLEVTKSTKFELADEVSQLLALLNSPQMLLVQK
ncbi:hypothetical protein G7Y89_g11784 [Cudoniella acicularis]|uniref:Uncharacterized protein n=1 Tax=Cudoniella acicularis TaxID=354080 RepID=A0A8H4RA91_9HELO|nr:hypothetical protein G7Y89_g11784 [Cudoniella acicularis]